MVTPVVMTDPNVKRRLGLLERHEAQAQAREAKQAGYTVRWDLRTPDSFLLLGALYLLEADYVTIRTRSQHYVLLRPEDEAALVSMIASVDVTTLSEAYWASVQQNANDRIAALKEKLTKIATWGP